MPDTTFAFRLFYRNSGDISALTDRNRRQGTERYVPNLLTRHGREQLRRERRHEAGEGEILKRDRTDQRMVAGRIGHVHEFLVAVVFLGMRTCDIDKAQFLCERIAGIAHIVRSLQHADARKTVHVELDILEPDILDAGIGTAAGVLHLQRRAHHAKQFAIPDLDVAESISVGRRPQFERRPPVAPQPAVLEKNVFGQEAACVQIGAQHDETIVEAAHETVLHLDVGTRADVDAVGVVAPLTDDLHAVDRHVARTGTHDQRPEGRVADDDALDPHVLGGVDDAGVTGELRVDRRQSSGLAELLRPDVRPLEGRAVQDPVPDDGHIMHPIQKELPVDDCAALDDDSLAALRRNYPGVVFPRTEPNVVGTALEGKRLVGEYVERREGITEIEHILRRSVEFQRQVVIRAHEPAAFAERIKPRRGIRIDAGNLQRPRSRQIEARELGETRLVQCPLFARPNAVERHRRDPALLQRKFLPVKCQNHRLPYPRQVWMDLH